MNAAPATSVSAVAQTATLKPSHDRKVAFRPGQLNNFGLLPGRDGTCPGATQGPGGCSNIPAGRKLKVCYVYGLMHAYKGVAAVLAHNTFLMKNATQEEMHDLLCAEFARFDAAERRKEEPHFKYRFHWSGDFFSMDYATAAVRAMSSYPHIRFWTYTRNFQDGDAVVRKLVSAENLSLYLSLDPDNITRGLECFYAWKATRFRGHGRANLQICYMAKENDFAERYYAAKSGAANANLWDEVAPLLSDCPVDTGKLALEQGCSKCQKCIGLRQRLIPIFFKT